MLKFLRSPEVANGAAAGLLVAVAALVGQYAAQGMNAQQWGAGLLAIAGAVTLAVILRCWPVPEKDQVRAED